MIWYMILIFRNLFSMITSGQSNLTTGRIAAAHGRFVGIRQVALVWPLLYTLPWAHPSRNTKWHLDQFSRICTANGRVAIFYNGPPPLKIAHSRGDLDPPTILHDSLGQSEPTTQAASRLVQPFCTDHHRVSLYFTTGRRPSLLKIVPSHGDLDSHLMVPWAYLSPRETAR